MVTKIFGGGYESTVTSYYFNSTLAFPNYNVESAKGKRETPVFLCKERQVCYAQVM